MCDAQVWLSPYYSVYLTSFTNLKSSLNSSLVSIKDSLTFASYSYTTTTTTTTTTTVTSMQNWNEWQPWQHCVFFRRKRNQISNQTIDVYVNVSCDLISELIKQLENKFKFLFFFKGNTQEIVTQVAKIETEKELIIENSKNATETKLVNLKVNYATQLSFNYNLAVITIVILIIFLSIYPFLDFINCLQRNLHFGKKKRSSHEIQKTLKKNSS